MDTGRNKSQLQSLQALGVKLDIIEIPNVKELEGKYSTLVRTTRRLKEETQSHLITLTRALESVGEK